MQQVPRGGKAQSALKRGGDLQALGHHRLEVHGYLQPPIVSLLVTNSEDLGAHKYS